MKKPGHIRQRCFTLVLLPIICLTLTGCRETLEMQAQLNESVAHMEKLKSEAAALDAALIDLRRKLPAASAPEVAAQKMTTQATADLKILEAQLTQSAALYQQTEAAVAALQKDLATLQVKPNP